MLTLIENGLILTPAGWLEKSAIIVDGNRIAKITSKQTSLAVDARIDAKGAYIIPGGIDMHLHGGGGHDFMECNEEAFRNAIAAHMRHGTTALYPTLGAADQQMMMRAIEITEKLMAEENSPVMGLHLEGPYLNMAMAGGQIPEYIKNPDREQYTALAESSHCIKRWDASPELEGAMEFGEYITSKGIVASIAHTTADQKIVGQAAEAGYCHATHFYNAMTGVHKCREFKHEGTIESIFLHDNITVELIADGIHVPPAILRLVHKFKGVERTALITDAMACSANRDTESSDLFDKRVIIEDGVCKLSDRSALAGSIATMDRLLRTMVQMAEIPLEDAVRMSSETPARIMGIYDRKGSLEVGKDADIVLLDEQLQIRGVMAAGEWVEGTLTV